ncbi:MAG TPA: formimidoylglutamate deiminase [Micromonosporaceae bacterium]|jgi:formiminoglutamate deiminase
MSHSYHAEYACVDGATARDVRIDVANGRIAAVLAGAPAPPGSVRLRGLTLPGLANAHSHAFHRALRGRAEVELGRGHAHGAPPAKLGRGSFWTWRQRMYEVAGRIDPDQYHALARATFAEMALAGVTCVGEFHYLHHAPGGLHYADPNEMGHRMMAAAAEAGIRITLLDALYLTSSVAGAPLEGPQLRFGDGDVDGWSKRHDALRREPHALIGAAAHSVRAVPDGLTTFADRNEGTPTHIHLSEQRAENEQCLAALGRTPTEHLVDQGLAGPWVTAVHATHLSNGDIARLGGEDATNVCLCPTTERDLGDGIGPARALADAGSPLCLGSDSHAVIDLLEEARAVELDERLSTEQRGHFTVAELLGAATLAGHAALGWGDAGTLSVGSRADLVTVRVDTVRTAGYEDPAAAVLFGATAADVTDVVVDGRAIVHDGQHLLVADVPGALDRAIRAVWS